MTAPFGPLFPALAIGLALVAIATGPNYSASVPAAVGAVAAAGLTLADAIHRSAKGRRAPPAPAAPVVVGARAWLRSGRVGREEIVLLVDRLDRLGDRPELPIRPSEEIDRLTRLPDDQFRKYVHARLDAIEGLA